MSRDVRHFHVVVVAFPAVPIGSAQSGRSDFYDDAIGARRRIGDVDEMKRASERVVADRFHAADILWA